MKKNPLVELKEAGQSLWGDYLSRDLIRSGELKRLMEEDGLRGITSNPTIFQKAIEGSSLYDGQLKEMVDMGVFEPKELFLGLAMEDVKEAADILLPVHESSGGRDGFVSIEVSPDLAYETEDTIIEARRLFTEIGRKNVLVKVPATKPGLEAVERLTGEGVNVNVTLLFSIRRYEEVADAYLKGIEKRAGDGLPVDRVNSVASFFVSRVDTLIDKMLDERLITAEGDAERLSIKDLRGKAAVANARLAYQKFLEIYSRPRYLALKEKGAHVQRLLWGSTSTKDPGYSDIKYVEELIGPDTVNTMPEETMTAFKDHGRVRVSIEDNLTEAGLLFEELLYLGIDMEEVAAELEKEGVMKFSDSYFELLGRIAAKRDAMLREKAA